MTTIAGAVSSSFLEVPAFGAGALQSDVVGRTVHEGREPFGAFHTASESFPEGRIGNAEPPLPGVKFVGSRLALMEGETRVRLRSHGPG